MEDKGWRGEKGGGGREEEDERTRGGREGEEDEGTRGGGGGEEDEDERRRRTRGAGRIGEEEERGRRRGEAVEMKVCACERVREKHTQSTAGNRRMFLPMGTMVSSASRQQPTASSYMARPSEDDEPGRGWGWDGWRSAFWISFSARARVRTSM